MKWFCIFFFLWFSIFNTCNAQSETLPKTITTEVETYSTSHIQIDVENLLFKASNKNTRSPLEINLPLFNVPTTFELMPNDVIDDKFKTSYPDIYSYDIQSEDPNLLRGSVTLSPSGLYAVIHTQGQLVNIYPDRSGNPNTHKVEYGMSPKHPAISLSCGHDHVGTSELKNPFTPYNSGSRSDFIIGERRYNYRVAIVTTGEFYEANGNDQIQVMTVVVNSINSLNVIYSQEMSIRFVIGSRVFMYADKNTDPFTPDQLGGSNLTVQAGMVIPTHFSSDMYDIGHVFHTHKDGDGWTTGGIALIGSVCSNFVNSSGQANKASGWTGYFDNTSNTWINFLAHEFGHQFGANHTFNGIGLSCTSSIVLNNAFEIGSGTTIMSYNGICDNNQNIKPSGKADNYFHVKSLEEIFNYVYNNQGGNCGSPVMSNNSMPQVRANPCGAAYTMPKGTPFYLKGEGDFLDNDIHTYSWEQIDEDGSNVKPTQGMVGNTAANSTLAPLFRSFPPSFSPERYFPSLDVLNSPSGTDPFEVLPNVARELNFNISIRDNNIAGGAVANDDVQITVSNTGPFVVTRPNGGETFVAGATETLTWNTNNSNSLCNNIRIKLSLDGGFTYPVTIAENVPYASGSYMYTIPQNSISSTKAKILMECMDYDCFKFFDISGSNFTITSSCSVPQNVFCLTTKVIEDQGSPSLLLNIPNYTGNQIFSINKTISTGLPVGNVGVNLSTSNNCKIIANNFYQKIKILVTASGLYRFRLDGNGFVSVFSPRYVPSDGCADFVVSSARETSPGFISRSGFIDISLNQCQEYEFVFYSFNTLPQNLALHLISGPGMLFEYESTIAPQFQLAYVLVNKQSDIITYTGLISDLRNVVSGDYTLYSVVLDKSANISNLVGQTFANLKKSVCTNIGFNSRDVTIKPTCIISDIEAAIQTPCNPAFNKYNQDIIVTYTQPPSTGSLYINGRLFPITGSPQTIKLLDLNADNNNVHVFAFFTQSPACSLTKNNVFKAPPSCCPIILELGDNIMKCVGDGTVKLEAGSNPDHIYNWTKDGVLLNTNQSGTLFITTSGLYGVEVTHPSGCKKSDTIRVTYNAKPEVTIQENHSFCKNEKYQLNGTISGASKIEWYRNGQIIMGATSSILEITTDGVYRLAAINSFGCANAATANVITFDLPTIELGPNQLKCDGDTTILIPGNSDLNYVWFKDGAVTPISQNKTLTVTQSGNYSVQATNTNQCLSQDEVRIDFFSNPMISDFQQDIQVCQGDPYTLTANASDYQTLRWFFNGVIIPNEIGTSLMISTPGLYTIEALNQVGCTSKKQTNIIFRSKPNVQLGPDLALCSDKSATLKASGGLKFEWSRNNVPLTSMDSMIIVNQSGIYQVSVTNVFNCATVARVKVDVFEKPVIEDFSPLINSCQGTELELIAKATNFQTIQWYYENNPIGNSNSISLKTFNSGNYAVEASNIPGCSSRKETRVEFRSVPNIGFKEDIVACRGTPVVLLAGTDGILYEWAKDGVPIFNTENNLTVIETARYQVTVTNSFNCSSKVDILVTFSDGPEFTLNGDTTICEGESHFINITTQQVNPGIRWFRNNELLLEENGKTLLVTLPGNYEAWVKGGTPACDGIRSVIIKVSPKPAVNLGSDRTFCEPTTFPTLNAGSTNTSFVWSLNGTQISTNQTIIADISGTYSVKVKNSFNCERTEQVKITIGNFPSVNIDTSYILCQGTTINVAPTTNGTKFQWRRNDITINNATSNNLNITTPAQYTFISSNDADCRTEKSFNVVQRQSPTIKLGNDTTLCPNAIKILNAGDQTKYLWSDGSTASTFAVNALAPTILTIRKVVVTVTNEFNCSIKDSINITLLPVVKANLTSEKTSVCKGSEVELKASGGIVYKWTETGSNTLSNTDKPITKATLTTSNTYTVEVGDNLCPLNKESKSITITVFDDSKVNAGNDTCIIAGRSLKLKASGGLRYQWDNVDLITGPSDIADPIVNPISETIFNVTITDINECIYLDAIKVCINTGNVRTISIITPNNDGKNDQLIFPGLSDYPNNTLRIFNRWGNVIFEADGYQNRGILFNGERNGERLPPDTYYYILTYEGKVIKSALTILWD